MIRYIANTSSGAVLAGIGLSEGNLVRLRAGKAIILDDFVPGYVIVIHYGKTEQAIHAEMRAHGIDLPAVEFDAEGSPPRTRS